MGDHETRRARAGLTQVIEPADSLGVHAVEAWGPQRLVEIISGSTPTQSDWISLAKLDPGDGQFTKRLREHLGDAIERWRRRSKYFHPDAALDYLRTLGGRFLTPEDHSWPTALADLQDSAPLGLWVLGEAEIPSPERILAVVGSREATTYGDSATSVLVRKARSMGLTVLSGGAYGIDAQAHREALISPGEGISTIAILAGGLDRLYPVGNVELLRQIGVDGLLVTEMPPGMRPNRYRFLNRNRLIAALSSTSIVIEARYRSGALSTANHAHDLGRTVGAVPGPINVPSSAGCHRLIKETPTLLIDDPADLEHLYSSSTYTPNASLTVEHERDYDVLNMEEMLVFDALPVKTRTSIGHLTGLTGLSVPQISGVLTKLERHELAEQNIHGWRKHRDTIH